jgi:hypothetical protein
MGAGERLLALRWKVLDRQIRCSYEGSDHPTQMGRMMSESLVIEYLQTDSSADGGAHAG